MKTKSEKRLNLEERLRKLKEWSRDWNLRLDKNGTARAALDLSQALDRARLDELLAEQDELKKEFELLRTASAEIIEDVHELIALYRAKLN